MPEPAAFVTGGSGFLGRHLVRELLRQGRTVLALCRDPSAIGQPPDPSLRLIEGALEQPERFASQLARGMTLFHLASARNRPGTPPPRQRLLNVDATLELARRAAHAGVERMVYVSTALVFGPSRGGKTVAEEDRFGEAIDSYTATRIEALEGMRRIAAEGGLPLVSLFPAIIFGPDAPGHPNRVTAHLRTLLRTGLDVVVAGGTQRRSLVYVDDVVQGLLLAERRARPGAELILGGDDVSPRELNRLALAIAGRPVRARVSIPLSLARAAAALADVSRGHSRRSGYVSALSLLTREWCFSSRSAQREVGYSWRPLRTGLENTLRFIADRP
jgi:nucleoside-diphosphate-sugar epimerase